MENSQPVESKRNSFYEYFLVTVIFIFVVMIGIFVYRQYRASREENSFRVNAPSLVIAGENLIAINGQSADNVAFRALLDEVRAKYNAIDSWPLKHTQANYEYVQAIEGWTLAAEVWDLKMELNSEYAYQEHADLVRLAAYLDIESSKLQFFPASDLVRQFIYTASEHARNGKRLLGY